MVACFGSSVMPVLNAKNPLDAVAQAATSHDYFTISIPATASFAFNQSTYPIQLYCFGLRELYNFHHEGPRVSTPCWRMLRILSHAASATSTTSCRGFVDETSSKPPRISEVAYKGGSCRMGRGNHDVPQRDGSN